MVISSRTRIARNLEGFPVPHEADPQQLVEVQKLVLRAAEDLGLETHKRLTEAERDYLIGCRLLSPEFEAKEPGRALLMDAERSVSIMINEEDHLRLQAVTAGWSIESADRLADHVLARLEGLPDSTPPFAPPQRASAMGLRFAKTDAEYVTASPINAGGGRRLSAMFHLIGLANAKRLVPVLNALAEMGMTARGVFGESSRGVGAFFQVSVVDGPMAPFVGACEYLIGKERDARREVPRDVLGESARAAADFAIASNQVTLADALRVLAWARWASAAGIEGFPASYRDVDQWVSILEIRSGHDESAAARHRAAFLRERLG